MKSKHSSLWISGLLTGAAVGYYLYKNRDRMPEQKEKLKTLISDLKDVALELKTRIVETSNEALNSTKAVLDSATDSLKDTAKDTAYSVKDAAKDASKNVSNVSNIHKEY